jgi:glyoxylase-like metal-dependent hydrolase (beta-lactamase superfamily II)
MFGQNTYVAGLEQRSDCVVVDPGFDVESIHECLVQHHLTPQAILNTHGHVDHIAGNEFLKRCWPECPLVIGAREADKLIDPQANLSGQLGTELTSPPADKLVHDGDVYHVAGMSLEVLEIPGHSRGHVVYVWKGGAPWIVFGGDVLFQGSIGRTDFPDGDLQQLLTSIRSTLFVMPDETLVLSGHGPPTTIGDEKQFNPFLGDPP